MVDSMHGGRVHGGYYNVHECQFCHCTKEKPCATPNGPCFWVDGSCSICSCCARGRGIKIRKNAYRMDTKKSSSRGRLVDAIKSQSRKGI